MPRHSMYQRISTTLDICCIIQYSIQAQKSQGSKGVKWHFEKKKLKNISFTFSKRKINIGSLWPQSRQWLRKKVWIWKWDFCQIHIFCALFHMYGWCLKTWKCQTKPILPIFCQCKICSTVYTLCWTKSVWGGFWKNFWISLWKLAKWCGTSMDMLSWP